MYLTPSPIMFVALIILLALVVIILFVAFLIRVCIWAVQADCRRCGLRARHGLYELAEVEDGDGVSLQYPLLCRNLMYSVTLP